MKKILLTIATFTMMNFSAHCMANESDLLYILPPQISYTTIVREFVADLEDHQQNHRFNNYKIQNGG